jgi:hypothetical protein
MNFVKLINFGPTKYKVPNQVFRTYNSLII